MLILVKFFMEKVFQICFQKLRRNCTSKTAKKIAQKGAEKVGEKTGQVIGEKIYDKFSSKPKETPPSKTTDEVKGDEIIKYLQKENRKKTTKSRD